MKKHALTIALASALILPSAFATAATGNIKFEGVIHEETCSLAASSTDITVQMGSWSTNYFNAVGDQTLPTEFRIELIGCDTDDGAITAAEFTFAGPTDTTTDYLRLNNKGAAGTAGGVAIGLSTTADLSNTAGRVKFDNNTAVELEIQDGDNSLILHAFYEQLGATVAPGEANANATFVVSYS